MPSITERESNIIFLCGGKVESATIVSVKERNENELELSSVRRDVTQQFDNLTSDKEY